MTVTEMPLDGDARPEHERPDWVHTVPASDYRVGDVIWFFRSAYRIERFGPYVPEDAEPARAYAERLGPDTRVAYCDRGMEITMPVGGCWPMSWEQTPPAYRARFLTALREA